MSSGNGGRSGAAYRALCDQVYRSNTHCWLCGQVVDPSLRAPDPRSRSVDHVTPLHDGGSLLDPANARLAHLGCNSSRGRRLQDETPHLRRW
ncbi:MULTISPECIES: HNH endonuclease [unclassified Nonomuraea]|uniref:HNH endonuclease n=1 Tax=unclassified Nonomuraea TaxID=2593643 RepID=UPI0033F663CF